MPDTDRQVRPFPDVLQDLRRGRTHRELSDELNDLVEAVRDTGRGGSITLVLKLKPTKTGTVEVADRITVKAPEGERDESLFFVDGEQNLVVHDPRQPRLGLRPAGTPDTPADEEATTA